MALKQNGTATIARLAEMLQLTGEAVRQQLLQLQREGWVEAKVDRSADRARTGRPATIYRLTEGGDHLFPKHYDSLTISMLDAVAEALGPEATERMLGRVMTDKVTSLEPVLRGLPLEQKIAVLKNWYLDADPYMEAQPTENGWRLIERNCPFLNTALHRPALCSVSVNALTKLLGVKVLREEKFQTGHGRCVFRVFADQPIDTEKWGFQLESELERS